MLTPCLASALNPSTPLQDYHHTTWTAKDGVPTNIDSITQTRDGWLWMTSVSGLHRFDGVRFERYHLPGSEQPLRRRPASIRAMPNGDLLISYFLGGGLSLLHPDGTLEDLAKPGTGIEAFNALTYDDAGNIWLAAPSGMHHYSGGKWRLLGKEHGLPNGAVDDIRFDRQGNLWLLNTDSVFVYDRAADKFNPVLDVSGFTGLLPALDGRMWVISHESARLLPVPPATGQRPVIPMPGAYPNQPAMFDRDGNLWNSKCPIGLCLTANAAKRTSDRIDFSAASSRLNQPWQMSSLSVNLILEDREGNIWVATKAGLERFRDTALTTVHVPGSYDMFSLNQDDAGQVWVVDAANDTAWKVSANSPPVADRTQRYHVSANDRNGGLLLATDAEIERRYKGTVEKIPLPAPKGPNGKPIRMVVWGMQDNGTVLWMMSPHTGLLGWVGDRWLPRTAFKLPPRFVIGTPDNTGGSWLALIDGTIVRYSEDRPQPSYSASTIGQPTAMFSREHVIAAGDRGMAVFKDNAFHQLRIDVPELLSNVSGMAITSNGDRWFNGARGLLHVRRADWLASAAQPSQPLRYKLFSLHDGYRGEATLGNRLPSMLADKDDRLWISGTGGLMSLDTRNIVRNPVAPVVFVSRISTLDGAGYAGKGKVTLPAGAHSFNIHYTAPSLRQPEKVRFQYRLDGEDNGWQDAGNSRSAFYTGMSPGLYRFHVRAANEDGVWSEKPATIEFEIPATFTQTWWFRAGCVLAAAALLYLIYLYRLRVVTARLEERMEVRLAERERIARTLHDTFLQSVQGVVLRLDAAVDTLPDDSAAHKSLSAVLHSARTSISEGRAQVHELRSADIDEVESRLRDVAALLANSYPGVQFALEVSGQRTALRATVVNDISEIASEALRNAYQHAHAERIDVQLDYAPQQFTLLVRDNGQGMAPAPAAGHWGLVGMRERAARIGAALEISSTQNEGSDVKMSLSARRAYADSHTPWWRRLFGK
ncbi:hypothetical protein GTP45_09905 [Pseudoduganella sp. FT55W]|uniref:Histidine kinase/HSP90-like ATPase domain-containing protein n=1 Tax=Duganella rivi TaxID=2666083 RepID=A0A7X4GPE1_9BURK|nr:sensor histidine kinase [Duganella rivi]MYM67143.1 hypothetical protein [Duganella rivi]